MLMNNLDPEVAERPDDLVVYGGTGRAARSWEAYDAIVRTLQGLSDDETLLVQSGKPVGVFRTHEWAPRVLIANSHLVPRLGDLGRVPPAGAARADHVRPDDRRVVDLHRHPGDPAGDLRDLRRERRQPVRRHAGRHHHLTAGLGGMGGAQPLAVTMNDGVACASTWTATASSAAWRPATWTSGPTTWTTPSRWRTRSSAERRGVRWACWATPPRCSPAAGAAASTPTWSPTRPRRTTSQLRPHRPLVEEAADGCGEATPDEYSPSALGVDGPALRGDGRLPGHGRGGVRLRQQPRTRPASAATTAFDYPGFLPAYIRPLFCEGKGPFRWVALSGDPADIAATDEAMLEEFPETRRWPAGSAWRRAGGLPGLPARICWLGYGERTGPGCVSTRWWLGGWRRS